MVPEVCASLSLLNVAIRALNKSPMGILNLIVIYKWSLCCEFKHLCLLSGPIFPVSGRN